VVDELAKVVEQYPSQWLTLHRAFLDETVPSDAA
jgi:hypothetical protein